MPVTQHVSDMIATARAAVNHITVHKAAKLQANDQAVLIDLRDMRELHRSATFRAVLRDIAASLETDHLIISKAGVTSIMTDKKSRDIALPDLRKNKLPKGLTKVRIES